MEYPLSETPGAGTFVEVEEGIYWLSLPLPFELNHINVWLLDDGDGWTLIDSGACIPETKEAWGRIFASTLGNKSINRLIVTHHHPDHFGLAKWLCDRFKIDLYITGPAIRRATSLIQYVDAYSPESLAEFYHSNGVEEPANLIRFTTGHLYRRIVSGLPDCTHIINAGMEIIIGEHLWKTIISNGHAEGHLALYCEELNLLISGDQVLPTITSNISLFEDDPDLNPLQEYLDSFEDFRHLPDTMMVLPSHGKIFRGLQTRVDTIKKSHMNRSAQVYDFCKEPSSVCDIADKLFTRPLDDMNWCLAFGETYSHLRYLEKERRIKFVTNNNINLYHHI